VCVCEAVAIAIIFIPFRLRMSRLRVLQRIL